MSAQSRTFKFLPPSDHFKVTVQADLSFSGQGSGFFIFSVSLADHFSGFKLAPLLFTTAEQFFF